MAGVGAATSLASAIGGAISSAQANNKARSLVAAQRQENKDWYARKMAEDYTQRSDAQAVLNKQRELLNEQYRQAKATNIVAGGTDESLALQQQNANRAMAQTMSDIAADASSHKDAVENAYRRTDAELNNAEMQSYAAQGQAAAQAGSQGMAAGMNLMGAGLNAFGVAKTKA